MLAAPVAPCRPRWSSGWYSPSPFLEERPISRSPFVRHLTLAVTALVALGAGLQITRPVFVGQASVAKRLVEQAPAPERGIEDAAAAVATADAAWDRLAARAPWIAASPEEAMRTAQFERDRAAFFTDLIGTGKVSGQRAARIADAAVRQAYTERVPPALVLGVMLTENDELKPTARSKVGAVGLMQVMPTHWRTRTLRERFGTDLRDDATNIRYGVFILGHFTRKASDTLAHDEGWRKALLTYNGCVRGTNTPDCKRYPDVVRRQVLRRAGTICGGMSFDDCVVRPMWLAMRVRTEQRRSNLLLGD